MGSNANCCALEHFIISWRQRTDKTGNWYLKNLHFNYDGWKQVSESVKQLVSKWFPLSPSVSLTFVKWHWDDNTHTNYLTNTDLCFSLKAASESAKRLKTKINETVILLWWCCFRGCKCKCRLLLGGLDVVWNQMWAEIPDFWGISVPSP